MLADFLSGTSRLPSYNFPSAVDSFRRSFLHLENGGQLSRGAQLPKASALPSRAAALPDILVSCCTVLLSADLPRSCRKQSCLADNCAVTCMTLPNCAVQVHKPCYVAWRRGSAVLPACRRNACSSSSVPQHATPAVARRLLLARTCEMSRCAERACCHGLETRVHAGCLQQHQESCCASGARCNLQSICRVQVLRSS